MLVLDASAVIAWVYDDERGLPDAMIDHVAQDAATVPAHWVLEVTNTLLVGERRGRLHPGKRAELLSQIQQLPIRTDDETFLRGWQAIPALAEQHGLTTYDAAYLELALRLEVPLATLDQDLARAARTARVKLFT